MKKPDAIASKKQIETSHPEYLPISMLNQLEYCRRRFWYMYVQGEMAVNAPVLEGQLQHQQANTPGASREGEELVIRRAYVHSERLRLAGFLDLLEEHSGQVHPVEYKHGRTGKWLNDHIQLCAQALCLEERLGQTVSHGFIFYWGSRRRQRVEFTLELRRKTEEAVALAFALLEAGRLPPPLTNWSKCRECSLEPICLPREVLQLTPMELGSEGDV